MYSLADGGFFGRGLGQSVAKWNYLPNAHNDFIFAIIGEELGFVGCAVVIGLFAVFVYTGLRIAARSIDPFWRLLSATATTWIVGQAMINIGYVIGLLPVTGLQLPLVSAGGSSLAITLFMFGVIANAARHEPEAVAALNSGQDGKISKLLRLPKPVLYHPPSGAGRSVDRSPHGRSNRHADATAGARSSRAIDASGQTKALALPRIPTEVRPLGHGSAPREGRMVSVGRRRHVGHKIHEKFESEEFVGERQQIGSVGSGGRGRHGWSHRTRTCCRGRSQGRCARHQNHCARDGAWSRNHLGAGSRVHARAHSPGSASS